MSAKQSIQYLLQPGGSLRGRWRLPGDKSISHRSIMLGSLAEGTTEVSGFLEGEDSLATLEAFRAMGVDISGPEAGRVIIKGVGLHGLQAPQRALNLGNSGTSMRLLSGLLAGQGFAVELSGDSSLSSRPMERVTAPLRSMGAHIDTAPGGRAPLQIGARNRLIGIHYTMPVASAQVKSALLLASLYAEGKCCVDEPAPTRDHTERMLQGFGYPVERNGATVCLQPGGRLVATSIDVPSDISSAAFFMVGAAISERGEVALQHVGINPTRTGIINLLRMMGADITLTNERSVGGEPVADITVRSSRLHGITIPEDQVPLAIDEFPVLFVAAACAEGETVLRGAAELRVKESDRLAVMATGLTELGISATTSDDGIVIQGGTIGGGEVDSHGDHRIAMAFAIASLRATASIRIRDCNNVATSFPGFVETVRQGGMRLTEERR